MTKWSGQKPEDNIVYNKEMLAKIPNPESREIFKTMVGDNPNKRLSFVPFQYSANIGKECNTLPLTSPVYKCKPGSVIIAPLRLTLKQYTPQGKHLTFRIDVSTPFYKTFAGTTPMKFLFHTFVSDIEKVHNCSISGVIQNDDELLASMNKSTNVYEIDG
jgi:hypothetical protein